MLSRVSASSRVKRNTLQKAAGTLRVPSAKLRKHYFFGSARNKVRGDTCAENAFALIDEPSAAMEPEKLGHISLGQENPRMRMNAAPG